MNSLEKSLKKQALDSGAMDFPGFKIQAFEKGKKRVDLGVGKTYDYYDMASITKIVFTTSVLMECVAEKRVQLTTPVKKILPWYKYSSITVGQLLNHTAGNEWWRPFYASVDLKLEPEQKFLQVQRMCREAPLSRSKKSVYSDIDFYLLGAVLERLHEKPLIEIWQSYKEKHFPKTHLHFNYKNKSLYKKSAYAPTEKCLWRKKHIQGEVHDENAWAMGGVAPQAGLFARIQDLSAWGLSLRRSFLGQKSFLPTATVKKFTKRSGSWDWGYGFMIPSLKGSSAGEYFSKKSFGHTGFTGTSIWFDPTRDLLICLLSNRVNPTRKNRGFIRLRPKLHDWIVQGLKG